MPGIDYLSVEPFEICSIRPPTENYSLTFRLTRNCYWNKCRFCPVYKTGARFSKRSQEEIFKDIERARIIDDLLFEKGIGLTMFSDEDYVRTMELCEEVRQARWEAGIIDDPPPSSYNNESESDPRLAWFRSWFKDKPDLYDSFVNVITWRIGGGKTCFLGDADSLILDPEFFSAVTSRVKSRFPSIERFTIYGRSKTAYKLRSVRELAQFHSAGLERVHVGLESGCDEVLSLMNKGVTAEEQAEGCLKIKEAGLSCSVYVMPGLGGSELSRPHAEDTAGIISRIGPDFVRLRSLEIFPQTPLELLRDENGFREASEDEVVREIRTLVENISAPVTLYSDSASNLLHINGNLPDDRPGMMAAIDEYLSLPDRDRLEFSLRSRMNSFAGQYGGFTEEIYGLISPYIRNDRLDLSKMPNEVLLQAIKSVRSRLMP